jgi:hypothetical protein
LAFDPSRIQSKLLNTGLQNKDNPLYQVIFEIINALSRINADAGGIGPGGGSGGGGLRNQPYVVYSPAGLLSNSRVAIAGTDISLDLSVPGQIIINNIQVPVDREWSVLTNGDSVNPELIFAGGDVIMLHTP